MQFSCANTDAAPAAPALPPNARPLHYSAAQAASSSPIPSLAGQPAKATTSITINPARRRSTTPTRDREKAELRALRAVEAELQSRLRALREAVAAPGGVRGRQGARRYVARRQLALRRAAERENRELRQQVAAQHRLSRELTARMAALSSGDLGRPHYLLSPSDQLVLERLARAVDRVYDLMPAVFPERAACDTAACEQALERFLASTSAEVAGGAAQLPGAQIRDDRELPHDFYRVIDASWRAMSAWHAGANSADARWVTSRSFPGVEQPEHTFAVRVRLQSEVRARLPVHFTEKVVVRRYIEPGRFVVVWLGAYDGEAELLGSRSVELGWIVVEQVPGPLAVAVGAPPVGEGAARRGRVRMRMYGRVIPTSSPVSPQSCGCLLARTSTLSCQEDFKFIYRHMGQLLSVSPASASASEQVASGSLRM